LIINVPAEEERKTRLTERTIFFSFFLLLHTATSKLQH
jgi:hypothetical protein